MKIHAPLLAGAATAVAATLLSTPAVAQAAPAQPDPARLAETLQKQLGSRTAGSYLQSGKLVVTVADGAAAQAVRAAGAAPQTVARDGNALARASAALPRITGTAWSVDPATNQVVVSVDDTVTGAALTRVQTAVRQSAGSVRLERMAGTLTTRISGGDAIFTSGARCSLGFNVRNSAGTQFFLTAGHCTNIGSTWTAGGQTLGTRAGSSFPGNDYGIVRYTNTGVAKPGNVNLYNGTFRDITQAGNAFVGQQVQRSGSTTGVRGGSVTATNATVNYPEGTVTGLIRTNVCAEPGDSGGSLFAGSIALGLTSGGSGNCRTGGTIFFQPVTEPQGVFGVNVY